MKETLTARLMDRPIRPLFPKGFNDEVPVSDPYALAVAHAENHSLLVEELYGRIVADAPPKWRLAALLHDAPEYVIGDMISPVKAEVGPGYARLDERLTAAIHLRFGLPATLPKSVKSAIKRADRFSAWLEAIQIAGFSRDEADGLFRPPKGADPRAVLLDPRPPKLVKSAYLQRHADLMALL